MTTRGLFIAAILTLLLIVTIYVVAGGSLTPPASTTSSGTSTSTSGTGSSSSTIGKPTINSTPCSSGDDCTYPEKCVNGRCVDAALPRILASAQTAATNLADLVRGMAIAAAVPVGAGSGTTTTAPYPNTYYAHAQTLALEAQNKGLTGPTAKMLSTLAFDLQAGQSLLQKYLATLDTPGCYQGNCGYYSQITSLTAASPADVIMNAASLAHFTATGALAATDAMESSAADLQTISDEVSNQYNAKQLSPYSAMNLIAANKQVLTDIANMRSGAIGTLATLMDQTGTALYQHFI